MKKLKLYISVILILSLSGCGDNWIDNIGPSTGKKTEKSVESLGDAEITLNGLYPILRHEYYYGGRYIYYGDVKGEDMQANGNTMRSSRYYLFDHNDESAPGTFWTYPYKIIRNVNKILEFTNTYTPAEGEESRYKAIVAEALAMRAMAHFDLVRIYGFPYLKDQGASLGVPIVDKHVEHSYKPTRNTVADVYDFIIADLETAREGLSPAQRFGKLNRNAIGLLLVRAYLNTGQNDKAFKVAKETITEAEKNKYALWTSDEYVAAWKAEGTSEMLWEINIKTDEGGGNEHMGYLLYWSGYDDIVCTYSFATDFLGGDKNDIRNKLITKRTKTLAGGIKQVRYYCVKYPGQEGENRKYSNIPVMRLSDLYLLAAEAAVKTGDNASALKYLNPIVERGNPANTVSGTVTIEQVLDERRKEFFGEGHRFFDAMRNNQRIERVGAEHLPSLVGQARSFDWNFNRVVLPISRSEMDSNPNIVQNPS